MKKILLFFSILSVLIVMTGCMSEQNDQKITVQKRMGEENNFEDFKEITQKKQVQTAIDIVKNANWENEKVAMARFADYQFQFPSISGSEGKRASYLLWVSPNGENLEIVTDSNKYVKLTKEDSAKLFRILTGEKLKK